MGKFREKRTFHQPLIVLFFISMSPQALHLQPADIPSQTEFIIYSPDHGLISEHCCEEEARASFASYLSECEMGEYIPFLLRRSGDEEWEIAEN